MSKEPVAGGMKFFLGGIVNKASVGDMLEALFNAGADHLDIAPVRDLPIANGGGGAPVARPAQFKPVAAPLLRLPPPDKAKPDKRRTRLPKEMPRSHRVIIAAIKRAKGHPLPLELARKAMATAQLSVSNLTKNIEMMLKRNLIRRSGDGFIIGALPGALIDQPTSKTALKAKRAQPGGPPAEGSLRAVVLGLLRRYSDWNDRAIIHKLALKRQPKANGNAVDSALRWLVNSGRAEHNDQAQYRLLRVPAAPKHVATFEGGKGALQQAVLSTLDPIEYRQRTAIHAAVNLVRPSSMALVDVTLSKLIQLGLIKRGDPGFYCLTDRGMTLLSQRQPEENSNGAATGETAPAHD